MAKLIMKSKSELTENTMDTENNHLLMYLLQNRAKDFITRFEALNNKCYFGVLSLYYYAYATKLLLSDIKSDSNRSLPLIEKCKSENEQILNYLKSFIKTKTKVIPGFDKVVKKYAPYNEDADIDSIFNGYLNELIQMGYRAIDILLYEAGMKFNYSGMIELLEQGANPFVRISIDYTPQEASQLPMKYVHSLYNEALCRRHNSVFLTDVIDYWKDGIDGNDTIIYDNVLDELFSGAGCQLVINIIRRKTAKKFWSKL
jgi:hypothetical protein